jgi:hypothetical protein
LAQYLGEGIDAGLGDHAVLPGGASDRQGPAFFAHPRRRQQQFLQK